MKRELKVRKIENGTVIDHIPSGKALEVLRLLNVEKPKSVMIAMNVPSRKYGTKDFIKLEEFELPKSLFAKISEIAPTATVNYVKDFEVVRKVRLASSTSS
jgi:aspartate carbamoyltransferase regulatory subunit